MSERKLRARADGRLGSGTQGREPGGPCGRPPAVPLCVEPLCLSEAPGATGLRTPGDLGVSSPSSDISPTRRGERGT